MNLRGVDLNLLVVFNSLMAERHLTRAGQRIGLSQPAMSAALGRLRQLLDDDLFIRSATGMQPTRRALEIAPSIGEALHNIEATLDTSPEFDPARASESFRVGMIDYSSFVLLPKLIATISRIAPGITVQVVDTTGRAVAKLLDDVTIDLAIGKGVPRDQNIRNAALFSDRFVCVASQNNPHIQDPLDMETYLALPHILVAPMGITTGIVDRLLAQRNLERKVIAYFPHFLVAPSIIAEAEVIATLPARVAERFCAGFDLAIYQPPLEIPALDIAQFWHRRNDGNPGHRWLRQQLHNSVDIQ